jgi:hypothetical protein
VHKGILNRVGLMGAVGCMAVGAVILAGCGGGSSSSSTGASGASGASGSAPLSQDEFVSQANAACKKSNDAIAALPPAPTGGDLSSVAPHLEQDLAIAKTLYSDLSALTPPSDMQAKYTQLVSDINKAVSLTAQVEAAAKANDSTKAQALNTQLQALGSKLEAEANALGLAECSKSAKPQG